MEPELEQEDELDYTAVPACNYFDLLEQSEQDGELCEEKLIENILNLNEKKPKPKLRLASSRK